MNSRVAALLIFTLLTGLSSAKDKNKNRLPEYLLQAHTVKVLVSPDASDALDHPLANSEMRDAVVRALSSWGRFELVTMGDSDLVITVQAGTDRFVTPAVEHGPADTRVGTMQPGPGGIGVGVQQGRVPALGDPGADPQNQGPHIGKEIGRRDDQFQVYRGGAAYSLHSIPLWEYSGRDALKAPNLVAVARFRKAIADAEKSQAAKKP